MKLYFRRDNTQLVQYTEGLRKHLNDKTKSGALRDFEVY